MHKGLELRDEVVFYCGNLVECERRDSLVEVFSGYLENAVVKVADTVHELLVVLFSKLLPQKLAVVTLRPVRQQIVPPNIRLDPHPLAITPKHSPVLTL